MVTLKRYYVYTLSYPALMGGRVFYVGKGTKSRVFSHEQEAASGGCSVKCDVIRKIWDAGESVQKAIVYETPVEQDALIYEWFLINLVYGEENLANEAFAARARFPRVMKNDVSTTPTGLTEVSTLKRLRQRAGCTVFELAVQSEVSLSTINRMEYGSGVVTHLVAKQVLGVLSAKLGRKITIEDVEGLQVKGIKKNCMW